MAVSTGHGATVKTQAFSGTPQIVVGRITDISGAVLDGGGYLSGTVRYTIDTTIPGRGVVTFPNQLPEVRTWPDDHAIDAGRLLGSRVFGVMIARELWWTFYEPPSLAGCATKPTPNVTPIVEEEIRLLELDKIASGGGGAPSSTPIPPGGGES